VGLVEAMRGEMEGRIEGDMKEEIHTLGSLDSNLLETLSLLHGPDDSFDQLFNLLVQTTNVGVLFGGLLVNFHGLDSAVVLCGECIKNEV
jgi:hypothetical protein